MSEDIVVMVFGAAGVAFMLYVLAALEIEIHRVHKRRDLEEALRHRRDGAAPAEPPGPILALPARR